MSLSDGTRLGTYEITGELGAGGMGEVYRAIDTKLGREVAIKTLPPEFAEDSQRLARLEREARLLASLNHKNIGAIFGLEDYDRTSYLVLELIEGDTLADHLKQGAIPVDQATEMAIQIAEALEAAHSQGVIHRDLKPENIKLRPDGVVKILDFGIAKWAEPSGRVESASKPTEMTKAGAILGTAAYMSPEQARGVAVDKRADVWAFGAVFYEMLTGKLAFSGRDTNETIAAVIKTEPNWSILPKDLPPLVVAFLKRCLAKDPAQRIHDIADVRLALAGAYELPFSAAQDTSTGHSRMARRFAWWAPALVIAVAAGIGLILNSTREPTAPAGSGVSFRQLTTRHGNIGNARFAPDGQVIVYGAAWDAERYRLYETRINGGQSRLLNFEPADLLAVSDNGMMAVSLMRMPVEGWLPRGVYAEADLTGGSPRSRQDNVIAIELSADGEPVAMVRWVEGQSVLEFPIGTVIHTDGVIGPPRVSPDGRRICFQTSYNTLMSAEPGGPVEVMATPVPRINTCAWSPDGDEIWFTYGVDGSTHENLEAVSLNGERRVLVPFPAGAELKDVSPNGHVLIAAGSLRYSAHGSGPAGTVERDLSVFTATRVIQLSADGSQLLLIDDSSTEGGGSVGGRVFTRSIDGTPPTEIGSGRPLAITRDGEIIAMLGDSSQQRITDSNVISLLPTGVGSTRTIELPIRMRFSDRYPIGINAWEFQSWEFSDDGSRLLIPYAWEDGAEPRVWVYDFENERALPITGGDVTGPVVLSPDGRFVASSETGGLVIYPVDGGSPIEVPGDPETGKLVRWSADPEVLFVLVQDGAGATVYKRNITTGDRSFFREVRVPDPAGVTRFDLWLSRDGETYAYTLDRWLSNLFVIENLP